MFAIHRTPPEVMKAKWAAWHEEQGSPASSTKPPPRPRNVHAVLDLGNLTYYEFRGRAYGVPPLPWTEGEKLMDVWIEIRNFGDEITDEKLKPYYDAMNRLAVILWKNTRPCGRLLRFLKAVRIFKNPFKLANEREVADVAAFYLGLRTKSTTSFTPGLGAQPT